VGIRSGDHATPLSAKFKLTSPTGSGRSVVIVRSRTSAKEFSGFIFSRSLQHSSLALESHVFFEVRTCENNFLNIYISIGITRYQVICNRVNEG
jgi:hypothetical protein